MAVASPSVTLYPFFFIQNYDLSFLGFKVTLADGANVGNHLHLEIKIQSREKFQQFLRSVTCLIARKITGAKKENKFGRFWQGLAFTRVLTNSLEELNLKGYIESNRREARQGYETRKRFLAQFNAWVYQERKKDYGFFETS